MSNSRTRFSNRVESYLRSRPHYPPSIVDRLTAMNVVHEGDFIADIGSGTGFSAEIFLARNCMVYGVEPNEAMRIAGEEYLRTFPKFISVNATAEKTSLPDHSCDLVVAGQAFHWFDRRACKTEFARIAKPSGHIVLMWNDRRITGDAFSEEYEQLLLTHGTDYLEVRKKNVGGDVEAGEWNDFFGAGKWQQFIIAHVQELDEAGLEGRLCSSSYVPAAGEQGYEPMMTALRDLFRRHQRNGTVRVIYDASVFVGAV